MDADDSSVGVDDSPFTDEQLKQAERSPVLTTFTSQPLREKNPRDFSPSSFKLAVQC